MTQHCDTIHGTGSVMLSGQIRQVRELAASGLSGYERSGLETVLERVASGGLGRSLHALPVPVLDSYEDRIERVRIMAEGGALADLSRAQRAALRGVLARIDELDAETSRFEAADPDSAFEPDGWRGAVARLLGARPTSRASAA